MSLDTLAPIMKEDGNEHRTTLAIKMIMKYVLALSLSLALSLVSLAGWLRRWRRTTCATST